MKLRKIALILAVLIGSIGCDQVTKLGARHELAGRGTLSYLGDTFRLVYVHNDGAFLGLGGSLPAPARTAIFTVLVAIFLIAFGVWLFRASNISNVAIIGASLVIGGGVGNLIDRIVFHGNVTDFMNMGIGFVRTGIFNVADVWIMVGAALLLLSPEARRRDAPSDADSLQTD